MKRPRRPTKRRKAAERPAKIHMTEDGGVLIKFSRPRAASLRKPNQIRVDDPFHIDPRIIPDGMTYQWGDTVDPSRGLNEMVASGWKHVPFKRHSKVFNWLENQRGCIVRGGLILLEIKSTLAAAQMQTNTSAARKQMDEAFATFRGHKNGVVFPVIAASFFASKSYNKVSPDAEPLDIEVKVKLRLSASLQDAAAALELTPVVYAQRYMSLYVLGRIGGVLQPSNGHLELIVADTANYRDYP